MIGTELGHYRLVALLGEGSMGRVFAADDQRLGRRVALKLMPDALAAVTEHVVRFQREARLLAAVNHPNVVTVHSVEEIGGRPFFTMEYIEGRPLADFVRPGGLPWQELAAIALPLAEGLAAAHAHGIVHRDLKPANVMMSSDGRLKIVDFGIAKPARSAFDQAHLTGAGLVLGTPAYMAPEQLRGEDIDARADLFAYAVLLYELATGTRPFTGASDVEIVSAILRDAPAPLSVQRRDLPSPLQEIVAGCLHKDREQRTPSAAALIEQLVALRDAARSGEVSGRLSTVTTPSVSALAVLPLEEVGAGVEDLLADGITEALIANLARVGDLKVISRSSVMRFRGSSEPLQDIARRLGVDALVCGSVRRAGNRIRISVELIDAASERVLWAEHYDRELEDVLRVQDEISDAIAAGVQARVGCSARSATPQRVDPEVYFLDLKGRSQVEMRTEASFRVALAHFREALARNPDYGPSCIGVARAWNMLVNYGLAGYAEARAEMADALQRASALRADRAEILGEQAQMRWQFDLDWRGAESDFQHALALAPSNGRLWYWRSFALATAGAFDAALDSQARARALDPLSDHLLAGRGLILHLAHRHTQAVTQLREVIAHSPDHAPTYWLLGMALAAGGEFAEAIDGYEIAIRRQGRISRLLGYLGHACACAGREARARELLGELQARAAAGYVPEYFFALIQAGLGDREATLAALERALVRRDAMLRDLNADPVFDEYRGEPRFRAVLAQLRVPELAFGEAGTAPTKPTPVVPASG